MNKQLRMLTIVCSTITFSQAQTHAADTVVIRVGEGSKVILAIHDKKDLEAFKRYDFQALIHDMISKLENKDTTRLTTPSVNYLKDTVKEKSVKANEAPVSEPTESWEKRSDRRRHVGRRTYHSFNIDLGTNNYLSSGKFPDQSNAQYSVRPWGSWYVGLNSIQRTHVAGKFFVEWGFGVSWYNFKFQDDKTNIIKDNNTVTFSEDPRAFNFQKSKLTASYLNASFVPVIDFGRGGRKTTIFDGSRVDFSSRGNHSSSFRIGVGPYVGYRIDSYTKLMFKDGGDLKKERSHDSFYLNDIRYGMRLQFGFNDVDFFFNYDLNNLFADNKGPKLNAFSFGITF
jgi:hypothetical protein